MKIYIYKQKKKKKNKVFSAKKKKLYDEIEGKGIEIN
jgi:hypothetical protein